MGLARWVTERINGDERNPEDQKTPIRRDHPYRDVQRDVSDYVTALVRLINRGELPSEIEKLLIKEVNRMRQETREMTQLALRSNTGQEYSDYVKKLKLTPRQKEKLMDIVAGYDLSVTAAREKAQKTDPDVRIPSKEQVIAHIMAMGQRKLKKIVTVMEKPGLVIETGKSVRDMKETLDSNYHYADQQQTYLEDRYEWSSKKKKGMISIVDEVQYPEPLPGQKPGKQQNDEQQRICIEYFEKQNIENDPNPIKLIADSTYTATVQKALLAYKLAKERGESKPEKHIPDYYDGPKKTVTIFYHAQNKEIKKVAIGCFVPEVRRLILAWGGPEFPYDHLRARSSVPVMEFNI